jgi:hypothetical protein
MVKTAKSLAIGRFFKYGDQCNATAMEPFETLSLKSLIYYKGRDRKLTSDMRLLCQI